MSESFLYKLADLRKSSATRDLILISSYNFEQLSSSRLLDIRTCHKVGRTESRVKHMGPPSLLHWDGWTVEDVAAYSLPVSSPILCRSVNHHLVAVEPGWLGFIEAIGAILNFRFCPAKPSLAICLLSVVVEGGIGVRVGSSGLEFHGEDPAVSLWLALTC